MVHRHHLALPVHLDTRMRRHALRHIHSQPHVQLHRRRVRVVGEKVARLLGLRVADLRQFCAVHPTGLFPGPTALLLLELVAGDPNLPGLRSLRRKRLGVERGKPEVLVAFGRFVDLRLERQHPRVQHAAFNRLDCLGAVLFGLLPFLGFCGRRVRVTLPVKKLERLLIGVVERGRLAVRFNGRRPGVPFSDRV